MMFWTFRGWSIQKMWLAGSEREVTWIQTVQTVLADRPRWKWDEMTPRIGLGTIFVDESLLGGTCELWAPSLT